MPISTCTLALYRWRRKQAPSEQTLKFATAFPPVPFLGHPSSRSPTFRAAASSLGVTRWRRPARTRAYIHTAHSPGEESLIKNKNLPVLSLIAESTPPSTSPSPVTTETPSKGEETNYPSHFPRTAPPLPSPRALLIFRFVCLLLLFCLSGL